METPDKPTGILIADDDPLILSFLRAKLESMGQKVFAANDGMEAVTLALQVRAALVILDVKMPKLDGILACARIRGLPGYSTIPIVMLSLDDTDRARAIASRAGASMFIEKPFGSEALMLAMSIFLPIDDVRRQAIHENAERAAGVETYTRVTTLRSCFVSGDPA